MPQVTTEYMTIITVRIPVKLADELQDHARNTDRSRNSIVARLLRDGLEREKTPA